MTIYLAELAGELGLDRSNLRRYILKKGIPYAMVRDPESRQIAMAFTPEDADTLRSVRAQEGFTKRVSSVCINGDVGEFYIVQLIPEFDPNRLKLGFTNDIVGRVAAHRTSSPTSVLVKSWDCKRSWERAAMDSATRIGCQLMMNEVYQCDSVENVRDRLDAFFSIMPNVRE